MIFALLLALLLPFASDSTDVAADTAEVGIEVGFRIIPSGFYSPSKGFGVGGAVVVDHLVAPGTELVVSAKVMQRYGRYRVDFLTGDPFRAPLFAGLGAEYETDRVRGFYGLGPQSLRSNKVYVSLETVDVGLRVGWHPLGTRRLLIQPIVRFLSHNVRSFRDDREDAFLNLDPASQQTLFETVREPTMGVTYGLELALDHRDRVRYSSRGTLVLLSARRYDGFGDRAFRYYAGSASVYGFLPLPPERHVLFARATLALTRPIGDDILPFYALPVLDDYTLGAAPRYRFHGRDLLAVTAGYRFPLLTYFDWFALDADVTVSLANAYDDLFEQFEPSVSFAGDLGDEGVRTPLRPSVSVGGQIVNLAKGRVLIGGLVGVDAEGYRFGSLRVVYGIRDIEPLVQ